MASLANTLLRTVVNANVRASQRTARALALTSDKPFWQRFEREAAEALAGMAEGATVIDLGGGRRCVYAGAVRSERPLRLIAVDVSAEELALNEDVSETIVADIAAGLPVPDASVDLLLSRAVLEHVDGVPAAARTMARALRPGGACLHFLPGRYSLFALAARALPFGPLLRLLHAVSPGTVGQVEFDVHYDECHPAGLERAFRKAGFREVTVEVCWASPGYFEPVYPAFLAAAAYEAVVRRLRLRRLASYQIVRAVR